MRRVALLIALAGLLAALLPVLAPGTASAALNDRGRQVISDCVSDGQLDDRYPESDYQNAYDNLPTDVEEYSTCQQQILDAQRAVQRGQDPTGGGPGGDPGAGGFGVGTGSEFDGGFGGEGIAGPNADEQNAISDAITNPQAAVAIGGGKPLRPGANGLAVKAGGHSIPGALLAFLILFVLGVVAATVLSSRGRIPGLTQMAAGFLTTVRTRVVPRAQS